MENRAQIEGQALNSRNLSDMLMGSDLISAGFDINSKSRDAPRKRVKREKG
jgi:hypothetical protein